MEGALTGPKLNELQLLICQGCNPVCGMELLCVMEGAT